MGLAMMTVLVPEAVLALTRAWLSLWYLPEPFLLVLLEGDLDRDLEALGDLLGALLLALRAGDLVLLGDLVLDLDLALLLLARGMRFLKRKETNLWPV